MSKLSPDLERIVLAKAGEGMTTDAIAAMLGAEYSIRISGQAIRKRLAQTRIERGVVATAIARESLRPAVLDDLGVLARERGRVRRLATMMYREATSDERSVGGRAVFGDLYLKALDRLVKIIDTRLHYAGADAGADAEKVSDDELENKLVPAALEAMKKLKK